jgi:hypothetical protein
VTPSPVQNLFHTANCAAGQAHLDAVWVRRRLGEDGLDHAFGCFAGALVLLQHNRHALAYFDSGSVGSVHICLPGARGEAIGGTIFVMSRNWPIASPLRFHHLVSWNIPNTNSSVKAARHQAGAIMKPIQ